MTKMPTDLLGHPLPPPAALRKDGRRRKIGYAARIGSGPKGQRCGNCEHAMRVLHRGIATHKCSLMQHIWNHDAETDVHLRAPACSEWNRKPYSKK